MKCRRRGEGPAGGALRLALEADCRARVRWFRNVSEIEFRTKPIVGAGVEIRIGDPSCVASERMRTLAEAPLGTPNCDALIRRLVIRIVVRKGKRVPSPRSACGIGTRTPAQMIDLALPGMNSSRMAPYWGTGTRVAGSNVEVRVGTPTLPLMVRIPSVARAVGRTLIRLVMLIAG